ncbi:amidohydrolase family protein [Acetobacter musti]|uniref:Amidohydrolase family protein n=1 Tax=Acetobacter musti TaxID=864732 RepID=A0ABX0JUJ8_9PROT|nr:amidohydrolase family protein [Acetobacter musti]NHN86891.1 amidohydrolase family protein [Acetobacter musti]
MSVNASAAVCVLLAGLLAVPQGGSASAEGLCSVHPGGPATLIRAIILEDRPQPRRADVLVDAEGHIACVGSGCGLRAPGAQVLDCPEAVLSAGFINPHDHLNFTGVPPVPDTGERFIHRHEWREGLDGHTKLSRAVATKDGEILAWGELRQLISGVTSMAGGGSAAGLVRNLDIAAGMEGLALRPVVYRVFPLDDESGIMRVHDCNYGPHPAGLSEVGSSEAFLAHVAEGTGAAARNEFRCLSSGSYDRSPQPDGGGTSRDVIAPQMTVLHGLGLGRKDLVLLKARGATIVWSPRSNLALYGRTLDVKTAKALGVPLAIGTDWLPSGSMNMSREFACARWYSRAHLKGVVSDRDLWRMATLGGARAVHAEGLLGAVAAGHEADLVLFAPHGRDPFAAAAENGPDRVLMVMRGGKFLYGDSALASGLDLRDCEPLMVGDVAKALCIRDDQPFAFVRLQADLAHKGIYPLVADGTPPNEPPCETLEETRKRFSKVGRQTSVR